MPEKLNLKKLVNDHHGIKLQALRARRRPATCHRIIHHPLFASNARSANDLPFVHTDLFTGSPVICSIW
jgi:hypothetical protein